MTNRKAIQFIRTISAAALALWMTLAVPDLYAQLATVTVGEGTLIRVRLLETLDSGTRLHTGSTVYFEVDAPVEVDGHTVIRPGARATGTITEIKKAKWGGRKGKLDFSIDYAEAVDGSNIRLRSTAYAGRGKGNVGMMAAATALVTPLGLVIRGKNAVVEKGTTFSVYIDRDTYVTVDAVASRR